MTGGGERESLLLIWGNSRTPHQFQHLLPHTHPPWSRHRDDSQSVTTAALAVGSGTAYPCPITVDMEPWSTSQLQVIHQSTCYYHQDLHYRRLRPASRLSFDAHRHATLLVKALGLIGLTNIVLKSTVPLTAMHRERALVPSIFSVTCFGR